MYIQLYMGYTYICIYNIVTLYAYTFVCVCACARDVPVFQHRPNTEGLELSVMT